MARIPEAELEKLKSEVDLVALVQSKGIELKRHGANDLVGHCPFHEDRTPSLVITPSKNLWHCLGACQKGGSVVDWVMKAEGVSFRHAVEILRSGQVAKILTPGIGPKVGTVPKLELPLSLDADDQKLMGEVIEYYHETLKASPEALSYLAARGIDHPEAIKKFKLGFANRTLGLRIPDSNRVAGADLRSQLQRIGLYRETGREHFCGSIVIPIVGPGGAITEVYGRKISKGLRAGTFHTYLPGPHRGVWNPEGLKHSEVILCEALIDALTFWVSGFKNVTASYGVEGFTEDHLTAFIQNGVKRVLIAYDRDEAGDRAAEKLALKLASEGIASSRVLFPKGMDANEYACKVKPASQSLRVCLESAHAMGKAPLKAEPKVRPPELPQLKEEEPSPPLVASPAPVVELAPEPVAEPTPEPPPAPAEVAPTRPQPLDVPTEAKGDEILIRLGDREYRVRGLAKNLSFEVMKVNLRVSQELRYHIDMVDLYQAKARTSFINAAAGELGVKDEVIKRDLGRVLLKLEQLQEEQIKSFLEGETKEKEIEIPESEREEALALLKDPKLLDRILEDFSRCGVIGEESNKLVGYLAAVSRKLDDPLAVLIQSVSAAGKSSLMEAVLAMIPPEEKVKYSAMTGQSLFYMGEKNLKHKILAIAEEQGAKHAAYALKLLQSEGEISIASTGKDPTTGRLVTHEYRVEGPVMIFLTTTAIEVDEELLNRCLVLTVNESRDQTRAIHELQRRAETLEGLLLKQDKQRILKLHQNAQRMLRPVLVANPLAKSLTFIDHQTRTRRDHRKYLTLIRAIALLHQYQRPVQTITHRGEVIEYIEVIPSDIETANRLCKPLLGRSLEELPPQTKTLLEIIGQMVKQEIEKAGIEKEDLRFTRKQVRQFSGWSDSQVQNHLRKLTELESVAIHRVGQIFLYELLVDPVKCSYDGETGPVTQSLLHLTRNPGVSLCEAPESVFPSGVENILQDSASPRGESGHA